MIDPYLTPGVPYDGAHPEWSEAAWVPGSGEPLPGAVVATHRDGEGPSASHQLLFRAVDEDSPAAQWLALFERSWPHYERWFMLQGDGARPGYVKCRSKLRQHLPQLVPTWERLVELAGGGDSVARMLSLYCPTAFLTGCTQAAWTRNSPILVRNYDYHPAMTEGTILRSAWNGTRVVAMSDCLWGVLDGINESGLSVSLAFGGRRVVGDGFGIPLILRYVLEFCFDTNSALAALAAVPSHMSYNVTVLDASGVTATVAIAPDRPMTVIDRAVATNHQGEPEWLAYEAVSASMEREAFVQGRLLDPKETRRSFSQRFKFAPLYRTDYDRGIGTLYTAIYRPNLRNVTYSWPSRTWTQGIEEFDEGDMLIRYRSSVQG